MDTIQTVPMNSMAAQNARLLEQEELLRAEIHDLKEAISALRRIVAEQKEKVNMLTDVLVLLKEKATSDQDIETKQRVTLALRRAGETTRSILSRNLR